MPHYTLKVKRKDIEYDISSEDKDLVLSQINLLFATMKTCHMASHSSFAPTEVKLTREKAEYTSVEKTEENEPAAKTAETVEESVFEETQEDTTAKEQTQPPVEETAEEPEEIEEAEEKITEEISEKPSFELLNKAVNTIELDEQPAQNAAEPVVEEVIKEEEKPARKGFLGIKSVFGMANKDKVKHSAKEDFGSILEEKIQKPTVELKEAQPKSTDFDSFIKSKNTNASLDYLIITAYYLWENEGLERFSLKQLNQKLFNSMKLAIDHKTVQKAIDTGLVRVMPDLTGIADITEYSITQKGEDYYLNSFKN